MANQSNSDKCCPFWDKYGKRTCRLVESGLFIPTRDHILHFCENENFFKCYHYAGKKASDHEIVPGKSEGKPFQNRRLFTRIPTLQKLSVSRYSMAREEDEDNIDDQAIAVDLSLGGMRIETNASINVNQIISFSFDNQFHPPGFKGKGEVRWIHQDKLHGKPSIAGLAFVDSETINTVRTHLLGLGEKLLHLS